MPKRLLRIALRLVMALLCVLTLALAGALWWLFFYTADLPDVRAMVAFCPGTPTHAAWSNADGSVTNIVAVPASDYKILREAVLAAEGEFPEHGVYREVVEEFPKDNVRVRNPFYSYYIAVGMKGPGKHLSREQELRTANQLERYFTQEQLLSIYLNRVNFGPDIFGIEAGAQHYFAKHAADLTVAEAALLAAIVGGPLASSPIKYPDRALQRRNQVLDLMVKRGSLTPEQAEAQKALPLGTTAK